MFFKKLAASALALASAAKATIIYAGVDESGGEFGVYGAKGTGLPGEFGVTYAFLDQSTVSTWIDDQGINFFRIAFLLERMCPLATGLGSTFNETYYDEYADAVNYITGQGAYVLLDPHNYYRYNDPSSQPTSGSIIGDTSDSAAATTDDFAAFWGELASRFASNDFVVFGLMNEPHDMSTELIVDNNQAAINAIRAAGANQLILAPGNGYTGGHSWNASTCSTCDPSSEWLQKLTDPANNTAIDIHEYLDEDFSGTHNTCTQSGPANLYGLTEWLNEYGLKAVISEFGAGANSDCYEYVEDLLQYLAANDAYIGWSAWAAGPFWGTADACCGPDTGNLEPGTLTTDGTPGAYDTVWATAIKPNVPSALKKSGISSLSL